jgi:hypothetical protein
MDRNCFCFLNFKDGLLISDSHFKLSCFSCQTLSEILKISEKDWQLNLWFSKKFSFYCRLLEETLMLLKNILRESQTQLSILLRVSKNLREVFILCAAFLGELLTKDPQNLENCRLSCPTLSEILRISEKDWQDWPETHQNLK